MDEIDFTTGLLLPLPQTKDERLRRRWVEAVGSVDDNIMISCGLCQFIGIVKILDEDRIDALGFQDVGLTLSSDNG